MGDNNLNDIKKVSDSLYVAKRVKALSIHIFLVRDPPFSVFRYFLREFWSDHREILHEGQDSRPFVPKTILVSILVRNFDKFR